ncbi:unnamed protein product [Spodoptera exigua]|nr:unnamed protein product [Spodoptera exigua]
MYVRNIHTDDDQGNFRFIPLDIHLPVQTVPTRGPGSSGSCRRHITLILVRRWICTMSCENQAKYSRNAQFMALPVTKLKKKGKQSIEQLKKVNSNLELKECSVYGSPCHKIENKEGKQSIEQLKKVNSNLEHKVLSKADCTKLVRRWICTMSCENQASYSSYNMEFVSGSEEEEETVLNERNVSRRQITLILVRRWICTMSCENQAKYSSYMELVSGSEKVEETVLNERNSKIKGQSQLFICIDADSFCVAAIIDTTVTTTLVNTAAARLDFLYKESVSGSKEEEKAELDECNSRKEANCSFILASMLIPAIAVAAIINTTVTTTVVNTTTAIFGWIFN